MAIKKSPLNLAALGETSVDRLLRQIDALPLQQLKRELGILQQPEALRMLAEAQRILPDYSQVTAIQEAHRSLLEVAKPFGGVAEMFRTYAEQRRAFDAATLGLSGMAGLHSLQIEQWKARLAATSIPDFNALYPNLSAAVTEAAGLQEAARAALGAGTIDGLGRMDAHLDFMSELRSRLDATRLKMSVLAGIGDTLGIEATAFQQAYQGLMGAWRTRPDLPQSFYRDPKVRRRHYEHSNVDLGLIEASPPALVEVVVESGLLPGANDETGSVAIIEFGGVSMAIRSADSRTDAYRALAAFEERLRNYISAKFEAKLGKGWFKHRVNGKLHGKAKEGRAAALRAGESPQELIAYTDLGDLGAIILANNNWEEFFADVFRNSQRFQLEMETLVAMRRPTMHVRKLDAVRLAELLLTMQRLAAQMDDDGRWKVLAEVDD